MPSSIDSELALSKAMHYCAYQERCIKEVKQKLKRLDISINSTKEIIDKLIKENYLNEQRFAISYASGKFSIKKWGKNKIKNELYKKALPNYIIEVAINKINAEDYKHCLYKLYHDKLQVVKGENNFIKKTKVANYLLSKGYETELIYALMDF